MPHDEFGHMAELDDGKVCSERSVLFLFPDGTDT